jgi:hypothetical protein
MAKQDEVKLIAFRIWQDDGCCDGRDMEHWLRAEAVWEQQQRKPEAVAATVKKPFESAKSVNHPSRKKANRK